MSATLDQALELVRACEPILANAGYHCGLIGSVLIHGQSDKDIDVVIYPHGAAHLTKSTDLLAILDSVGVKTVFETDREYVNKEVWICSWRELRIDFFFLQSDSIVIMPETKDEIF